MKQILIAIALVGGLFYYLQERAPMASPQYAASADVVLYSTDWCGYCAKTREFFAENNVPYVEYDIGKSTKAHQEFKALGGVGVPLVIIKDEVIKGYSPERMRQAL